MQLQRFFRWLSSMYLTVFSLIGGLLLVFMGTMEQASTGIYIAQAKYFQTWVVSLQLAEGVFVPIFPGGYFFASLLLISIVSATFSRFRLRLKGMGILVIHFGLIFLVVGEIITGISSVESQMPLNVGEVSNFSNSFREMELVIIDESDEELEQVIAIPQSLLVTGKSYDLPHSPLKIKIKQAYANSHLERLQEAQSSLANQGVGTRVFARALPAVTKDDRLNTLSAYVEILNKDDSSIGTWLLSNAIPEAQSFSHYKIQIRQQRHYHPFSLQLNEFIHTKHPGTNIPESFASQVTLFNADGEFERSVLISMNQPLYYQGKTFYQASYGENDTLSVLQVVDNPVKAAPYISSALVSAGLLIQFLTSFFSFARRR